MATPNPFSSPVMSIYEPSSNYSQLGLQDPVAQEPRQRRFKNARLRGEYEKPWVRENVNRAREIWDKVILWTCVAIGLLIGAFICWKSWTGVPNHDYCLILDDDFSNLDSSVWTHEVQIGGFGTGAFDWTTSDPANSYVSNNELHIIPTLTLDSTPITHEQLFNGYTLNLTSDGTCTSNDASACATTSNSSSGIIINPVRSARLTTSGKKTITYGRIEVVAKMPKGDWLWPAIWMMPEDSVYGAWPLSGEIDIAEVRGNDGDSYPDGRNSVGSALHWGTAPQTDVFYKTSGKHNLRRSDYSDGYHTYGLEWSQNYLYTYLDSRLLQVLYVGFGSKYGDMYTRGGFANMPLNGSVTQDPWSQTGNFNTPFDQNFYLILNVAVGGTSGFFPDSTGQKPWVDGSETAMRDFWNANSTWLPTWGEGEDRGMSVKNVKMWSQGIC